jgi:hypothetical protein
MSRRAAPLLALVLALGASSLARGKERSARRGPAQPAADAPASDAGTLRLAPRPPRAAASGEETKCAACHQVEGWQKVRFDHDRTGFPLRGGHDGVACGRCHARGFDMPVADTCSGCHRDRHAGELGMHCEGCHDERSWRPLFSADAHRTSVFPLVGKHATIPCQQCHGDLRDRTFSRAPATCVSCHQVDYNQTKLTSIDHAAAGFSTECQTCHGTWRFWPARVAQHDACFHILSGSHHNIRCLGCHKTLAATTFTGACATGTFTCSGCHAHTCARSDQQHTNVMGYQCADQKCYECHKLAGR